MSIGYLILNTTAAQKIIPVAKTLITVTEKGKETTFVTDESGKTPVYETETPDISLSETPSAGETPFSVVDVKAEKTGFYTTEIKEVQIFPERVTTLYINMVPVPEFRENIPLMVNTPPQNL